MKKYMKEHKLVVIATILLLLIIVVAFIIKDIFFSNGSNIFYGDRLKGISAVKITSSQKKDLLSNLKADSSVKNTKYFLQGKIVNIVITVNDDIGLDTAKSLTSKVLEAFDDDQKKYYDFQLFVKKDNGASDFPIIGYKQNSKKDFVWTKDRAAS